MAKPDRPMMVLMHGLSASGKTWTSDRLVTALPGIRVRSDLERKRLHGVPRKAHRETGIDEGLYSRESTDATYRALESHCETGLRAGFNMIADATFLDRDRRSRFIRLARRAGARPVIFYCTATPEVLRQRILARQAAGHDESDAGIEVLNRQTERADPLGEDERALTVRAIEELA
jgi:predicted kinase